MPSHSSPSTQPGSEQSIVSSERDVVSRSVSLPQCCLPAVGHELFVVRLLILILGSREFAQGLWYLLVSIVILTHKALWFERGLVLCALWYGCDEINVLLCYSDSFYLFDLHLMHRRILICYLLELYHDELINT